MKYDLKVVMPWFLEHGLTPTPEFRFLADRKFRFDFAFPEQKLALEVEGGVWIGGRHNRGSGFVKDMEKYNLAAQAGWRIIKCVPKDLCTDETIELIKSCLNP